jgi:hypothetical protein
MSAMDLSKMGTARVALNTSDCDHIVIRSGLSAKLSGPFINTWQQSLIRQWLQLLSSCLLMQPYAN